MIVLDLEQDAEPEDLAELQRQGVIDLENSDHEDDEAVSFEQFINFYDERALDAFVFCWYCKTCRKHYDFCGC